jgi:molybdopterin/thiamine biosynthesis adenylyltransferase
VGILGCMQAAEALKIIGKFGEPLTGRLLMVDARTMTWRQMKYRRDDECPCCSQGR